MPAVLAAQERHNLALLQLPLQVRVNLERRLLAARKQHNRAAASKSMRS